MPCALKEVNLKVYTHTDVYTSWVGKISMKQSVWPFIHIYIVYSDLHVRVVSSLTIWWDGGVGKRASFLPVDGGLLT